MRLPQFFIDRPIFAGVLSVLICLLGAAALTRLPVSEYPEVIPPSIQITAQYPGASPETIAATVAGPLEQQMTGLDGMLYMQSNSTPDGAMSLVLTFRIGTDLDRVLTDVQNRIQVATPRLPDDVRRLGVVAQKATRDMLMVVNLSCDGDRMSLLDLTNYAQLRVRDQLLRIPGVRDVWVRGASEYGMRVWLDPERMAARNLAPGQVVQAIREQNVQVAAGTLAQQPVATATAFELTITTQGRLIEPQQFAEIIVNRGANGQLTRLSDVGRVELGGVSYSQRSLVSLVAADGNPARINQPAVAMPIIQAPGSNALATAQAVRAALAEMRKDFPAGVKDAILYDPTIFIEESIHEVLVTLGIAIVLVVIVVMLFLQTWRASLIPLLAVPVSVVGTFAVMMPLGFSINALSLFGLVLAIGIVVDDAIVVVENVERNMALGLNPREATKQAMREVSGPILATALVLCSVFIPTALISGLTGRFYQQFALTIAISTAISAFNSLTLSPALAALILKPQGERHRPGGLLLGWFFAGFNRLWGGAASGYVGATRRILRVSALALLLYGGLLFLTTYAFRHTPTAFVPPQDKGFIICVVKLPEGASLDRTEAVVKRVGEIATKHPGVLGAVQFPGLSITSFASLPNQGVVFLRLRPHAERERPDMTAEAIKGALQREFFAINEAFVIAVPLPPILGLGSTGDAKLFLEDRSGIGLENLVGTARQVMGAVQAEQAAAAKEGRTYPVGRVYTSATIGVPRLAVDIDREKAVAQGVRLTEIYDALQGYFGIIYVNDFNRFGRSYRVYVQADAPFRTTEEDFARIKVHGPDGRMVPLSSYIDLREIAGTDVATQYNTYPAVDLNLSAAPGATGDEAQAAMKELLGRVLPPGVGYEWTEITYQQQLAGNTSVYIFPICVLLVFLVLAAFYESLVLPLAIVLIVPMCLLCALVGVYLTRGDNNIMTQIGLIVLVGLACKNAILIVEFAREGELRHQLSPQDAALEACRLRLRPIIMTSLAFIMGVWPLVDAHGAGAELRHATGVAVFAGMIGVTLFGLMLTPVFYVVLRKLFPSKLHHASLEHKGEHDEEV